MELQYTRREAARLEVLPRWPGRVLSLPSARAGTSSRA